MGILLKLTVLSISLLTVMSSAAVSPALAKIKQAFPGADTTLIKLILTLPSLFIIPASLAAGWLVKKTKKKNVLLMGLLIYAIAGIGGGFAKNITHLLVIRAIFGIGAGLIIPLSTSLIADFFDGEERTKMMGYSGSVSHFGGVIFLLLSGWLACMSWRYAFFVYALAVLSFFMIMFWLPEPIYKRSQSAAARSSLPFGVYVCSVLGILMMIAFYAAPTNLAMFIENDRKLYTSQTPLFANKEEFIKNLDQGTISEFTVKSFRDNGIFLAQNAKLATLEDGKSWSITDKNNKYIIKKEKEELVISSEKLGRPGIAGYFLSAMTMVGVLSGLILARLLRICGPFCAAVSIASMAVGYWLLGFTNELALVFVAMLCIGFSSGVLMPLLLLKVSKITPDVSRAMAMAVLSIGVYLGQFMSPVVLKAASSLTLLGRDPFRAQFNFLSIGLLIATFFAFIVAMKNLKNMPKGTATEQPIKIH